MADFVERLNFGHRYLELVSRPPWADWADGYSAYLGATLDAPAALLLAHPMWLRSPERRERIYGKRRFEPVRDAVLYECRAEAIWGYQCNVEDQPIQFDHRFPYAFGGPTVPPNAFLCARCTTQASRATSTSSRGKRTSLRG